MDLDRFRAVLARTPSIVERLFTPDERAYAHERRDPTERLGARFAAKEATLKALGAGLGAAAFADIEVVRASSGAPSLALHGSAADLARDRGVVELLLSISHTATLAQATVVALGNRTSEGASRPAEAPTEEPAR